MSDYNTNQFLIDESYQDSFVKFLYFPYRTSKFLIDEVPWVFDQPLKTKEKNDVIAKLKEIKPVEEVILKPQKDTSIQTVEIKKEESKKQKVVLQTTPQITEAKPSPKSSWFTNKKPFSPIAPSAKSYSVYDKITNEVLKKIDLNTIPNTIKALEAYIEIKTNTLKQIDQLISRIRLANIERRKIFAKLKPVVKKQETQTPTEFNYQPIKTHTLVYQPALNAVPMLMVFNEHNEGFFNEYKAIMAKELSIYYDQKDLPNLQHYYNHGAYVAFDPTTLKVCQLAFCDIDLLIFLLRSISKKLVFEFNHEQSYVHFIALIQNGFNTEFLLQH